MNFFEQAPREIGSEFWEVPVSRTAHSLFPETTQWYLSGRCALQAIVKELKRAKTVAMPAWCCDSMIKPFLDAGMEVRFYPVYPQERFDTQCDVLFVMDFFGYTSGMAASHPCVIRDVTHSLFSASYSDADYFFGSLRKWCGVWTGGYAWTRDGHRLITEANGDGGYARLREKAMLRKSRYIHGERENAGKDYLNDYAEAEELLEHIGIAPAADRDVRLAQCLDVELIKTRRRANAKVLMQAFPEQLIFPVLKETDCPMFVPVLVPDGKRDALRRYLIQHEIYCPVHWPLSAYHDPDQADMTLYNHALSLVCDQRYTEEDMHRMAETVKRFWKETR